MARTRGTVRSHGGLVAPIALFAAAWVASFVEIGCATGRVQGPLVELLIVAATVAVTWAVTRPAASIAAPGGRAGAQLVFLAAYMVPLMAFALHAHRVIDSPLFAPLDELWRWLQPIVGAPTRAINPLIDVALPGLVLLGLGARPRELGLTRGHHTWRLTALCCAVAVAAVLVGVAGGAVSAPAIGKQLLDNTLQNGPVEEIFWRGYVQTRLQRFGSAWAIAGTALAFGLWHIGAQFAHSDGDWSLAAARCIINQAMFGIALGVMFHRTRSVIAPSVWHVVLNTRFAGS